MCRKQCERITLTNPNLANASVCTWFGMNFWPTHESASGSSGAQLIKLLCRKWGYEQINQEGSHIILQTDTPGHQRLSVPNHNPSLAGTMNDIIKAAANHQGVDRQADLDPLG